MPERTAASPAKPHSHVFLDIHHRQSEQKTWSVITLCTLMMIIEIAGGLLFGSLALVADGLHMATHAAAMLIAALAYTFARRHVADNRFAFGTGKFGDLAAFTSAIILAMIAALIGWQALERFISPVPIAFGEALPLAVAGLFVNLISAWLLRDVPGHHHGEQHRHAVHHGHGHAHGAGQRSHDSGGHSHHDAVFEWASPVGSVSLSIFEENQPPRFRLRFLSPSRDPGAAIEALELTRPDGRSESYHFRDCGPYWESLEDIPEPHAFKARVRIAGATHEVRFEEAAEEGLQDALSEGKVGRDYGIRSAYLHVIADALVSVLAIAGLGSAWIFHWLWMDPLAGMVGALVIANWSYSLMRDAGAVLLDVVPDVGLEARIRDVLEEDGDRVADLHLWRLGPGHLGVILSVAPRDVRPLTFYRERLRRFSMLSHVTIEILEPAP
jgi:cation diffusion facilitator family transporter